MTETLIAIVSAAGILVGLVALGLVAVAVISDLLGL